MAFTSGKLAAIDSIGCVQSWQLSKAVNLDRYAASCTGDGTNTSPGNADWTGQIVGVGVPPSNVYPGADVAFDGTADTNLHYTGNILIGELTINFPKEAGGYVNWTASFGMQGEPTKVTSAAPVDASRAGAVPAKALTLSLGGTPVAGLRTSSLIFRRPQTTYIDNGLTYRKNGNIECDLNFDVYNDDLEVAELQEGFEDVCSISCGVSNVWDFANMVIGGSSNFLIDRNANEIIGFSVAAQWTAVTGTTEGYIVLPLGVEYFGTAPV